MYALRWLCRTIAPTVSRRFAKEQFFFCWLCSDFRLIGVYFIPNVRAMFVYWCSGFFPRSCLFVRNMRCVNKLRKINNQRVSYCFRQKIGEIDDMLVIMISSKQTHSRFVRFSCKIPTNFMQIVWQLIWNVKVYQRVFFCISLRLSIILATQ